MFQAGSARLQGLTDLGFQLGLYLRCRIIFQHPGVLAAAALAAVDHQAALGAGQAGGKARRA